jgi:putative spermidine/putrescine transport system permease protein
MIARTPSGQAVPRFFGRIGGGSGFWLLLPSTLLLVSVFAYPLISVVARSFTDPEPGLSNYVGLWEDGVTANVMGSTIRVASIVALATLLLSYPYAYMLTRVSPRARGILMIVAVLPFWTSIIARNFAWFLLLQRGGLVERTFAEFGVPNMALLRTSTGVTIAMVQVLLPYMIFPLYASLRSIDRRLLDAAQSMGAPAWRAFFDIYLPLSLPGIVSGLSLVFAIAFGFYVTPAILGSPQEALVAQLVAIRIETLLDFAGAGATALAIALVIGIALLAAAMVTRRLEVQLGGRS